MKKHLLLMLVTLFIVTGCASNQEKIKACQIGNWQEIGERDGLEGLVAQYSKRKEFCDKQDAPSTPQAAVDYANGWSKGNSQLWFQLGDADGLKGMAAGNFTAQLNTKFIKTNTTPLNQPAYLAGWAQGNEKFWYSRGVQDGQEGSPESLKETHRAAALAASLKFNEASYVNGWRIGNEAYWKVRGHLDGMSGEPASYMLPKRANDARKLGVFVNESTYRQGWENGLTEYWTKLGQNDAISGKQFALRKKEAMAKGLQILEQVYQTSWEKRLVEYWTQAGAEDGWGRADFMEQRIASAGRDGVFVIKLTPELYRSAWQAEHARYCNNENAFELGRVNQPMNVDVCGNERRLSLKRTYNAGQNYEEMNAKYQRTLADINRLSEKRNQTGQRLQSIEEAMRRDLRNKDRKSSNETAALDKRREADRSEFLTSLRDQDRQLEELKRREDRYTQQLRDLKREAYSN